MMPAKRSESLLAFLGVAVAAALVATLIVAPFVRYGNVSGHDFEFHTSSWLDVASQWKQGVMYPRWCQWANWGFGEPRFIFYPPASWILGSALGVILPWRAVPGTFIWLTAACSALSMFALARRWMAARTAAIAAIVYAASPYALVTIYLRSDFAELLAASLFPLLILYAVRAAEVPAETPAASGRVVAALAVIFAAIWLCNAPAGVLAAYTLCLVLAVLAIAGGSARPLLRGAGAMALGWLLAGFFMVPAAFEQRWVNISRALSSGLRPEENFLFTSTSDTEHDAFNTIVSGIAVGMLVCTAIAAIAVARQQGRFRGARSNLEIERAEISRDDAKRRMFWPLATLTIAVAALLLPISAGIWRWLPELRFLQFPWRWLGPLGVPFAYFLAAAMARARWRRAWQILALAAVAGSGLFLLRHAWWETDDLQVLQAAVASGQGFDGTDEYDPLGDDHTDLPKRAPQVAVAARDGKRVASEQAPSAAIGSRVPSGPRTETARPMQAQPHIQIERWGPEEKRFQVDSGEPVAIALRLLNYPAWRVEVNDVRVQPTSPPGTAQMIVKLPGGASRVRVRFIRTTDRSIGLALSAIGLVILGLLLRGRRQRRSTAGWRTSWPATM